MEDDHRYINNESALEESQLPSDSATENQKTAAAVNKRPLESSPIQSQSPPINQ